MTNSTNSISIFIAYSHRDYRYQEKLDAHLSLLKHEGLISTWHDRKIGPGEEWRGRIDTHLDNAQIILLLISPDFIASPYCYDFEINKAVERHNAREAVIIPIILRPCDWHTTPFGALQALPTDGKPVSSKHWHTLDEAFFNVAQGIRKAVSAPKGESGLKPKLNKSNEPWNKRILVIDDDQAIRELVRLVLEEEGYNVQAASNREQALLVAQTQTLDLILLDVRLKSEKDGFDVLNELREIQEDVPIIMLTDTFAYKRAFNRGAVDYIHKPFELDELIMRVKVRIRRNE